MLTDLLKEDGRLKLIFNTLTKGKFRFKRQEGFKNPYSFQLKKEDLKKLPNEWYIEWMITYFTKDPNDVYIEKLIMKDLEVKVDKNKIYPYELPVIYMEALKASIISKNSIEELINFVCCNRNTFEEKFQIISDIRGEITLNNLNFKYFNISLPLLVLENPDGSWIEVILQKQQYAYSIQPFVFLCIPSSTFYIEDKKIIWLINSNNVQVLENLFKVFASSSERHRRDVCEILKKLKSAI